MTTLRLLNSQPPEKPSYNDEGNLDVVGVFKTIQGEGPFSGKPSVFVRLAGCNLQCPMCDTDYTTGPMRYPPNAVLTAVRRVWENDVRPLIVITGGEPFRQNIGPFVRQLAWAGYEVQIETNGTLYLEDFPYLACSVVVSPKTPTLAHGLMPHTTAFKYVLEHGHVAADGLPTSVLGKPVAPARPWKGWLGEVYVQPCDDPDLTKSDLNAKAAVASCLEHGYRLSVQTHKILGLE